MKGGIENTKRKYQAIKDRYEQLNKLDDKNRPIYTYSNLMSKLAKEFYMQEGTIEKIILLDLDKWEQKERKYVPGQGVLFGRENKEQ